MTPLHIFLTTAQSLEIQPIDFWPPAEKQKILKSISSATDKLKKILEKKKLTDTHAYKQLDGLEKTVSATALQEVPFVQLLNGLVDIYKHSPGNEKTNELVMRLDTAVSRAKPKILEHHLLLEHLEQRAKKLSAVEQEKKDRETIQKIGIFYVLEYTLQVQFEFSQISDADKRKLLKEGLNVKAGNLPAFYPLADTLRKELCYNLFDKALRRQLLEAFFEFDKVVKSDSMLVFAAGLKALNVALLAAFQNKGLKTFKGLVYAPFGNNKPVEEIIMQVQSIKF